MKESWSPFLKGLHSHREISQINMHPQKHKTLIIIMCRLERWAFLSEEENIMSINPRICLEEVSH